jgi:amidase
MRWHDSALFGATVNPWDARRTPGGSSGGEAVAVATGMSPLGVGTDQGGSLRWPAQCNGTVALRPTLGRVPQAQAVAPTTQPLHHQLCSVTGPLARHVGDLRIALRIMGRPSLRDPWHVPVANGGRPAGRTLRVAVVADPCGKGVHPDVADGVRVAAAALEAAGYLVDEVEPPGIARAAELWLQLGAFDYSVLWPDLERLSSPGVVRVMSLLLESVPRLDQSGYVAAMMERHALLRAWSEFSERFTVVVAPVLTVPAFPVGADLGAAGVEELILVGAGIAVAVNLLGLPAVAVPCGTANGLPQVVQVIGPRFGEELCLEAAETIERACGTLGPIEPRTQQPGT